MPSTSNAATLDEGRRQVLLGTAAASIRNGLARGRPLSVVADDYDSVLAAVRATFVTLREEGRLRGCIGVLEAYRPLVVDVAENAFAAAFRDPRFTPLRTDEFVHLHLDISVLSPAEPMAFASEDELLRQIRPGSDGLILEEAGRRGTFLPSVWETLPERRQFLAHLKQKAGLPPDYWSGTLRISRYTTESFGAAVETIPGEVPGPA